MKPLKFEDIRIDLTAVRVHPSQVPSRDGHAEVTFTLSNREQHKVLDEDSPSLTVVVNDETDLGRVQGRAWSQIRDILSHLVSQAESRLNVLSAD